MFRHRSMPIGVASVCVCRVNNKKKIPLSIDLHRISGVVTQLNLEQILGTF